MLRLPQLLTVLAAATGAGCASRPSNDAAPADGIPTTFAPGVISDSNHQWRITFTRDGRTAFFAESPGFFPVTRRATIYESRLSAGRWSQPVVAPFSGEFSDIDPFITPDGRRLYFSSIRPVNGVLRGDIDIWYVERSGDGWLPPVRLGETVNGPADELYASVSADGTLYFASGPAAPRAGAHWDIYRARPSPGGFQQRDALGPAINRVPSSTDANLQSAWEFNPEISADGRTLVFTSLRPGFGFGDLYVSHFRNGEWSPAANLGPPVNSEADEYHPTLSPDGRRLYFARRIRGNGDFYVVDAGAVPKLKR